MGIYDGLVGLRILFCTYTRLFAWILRQLYYHISIEDLIT